MRRRADVVFVTPHWGKPFKMGVLQPSMVRMGRALIDAGADAVLGHGNHMLLGMESYRGRPILYDMGNFLFDQSKRKALRRQGYFRLEISRQGVQSVEFLPFEMTRGFRARVATGKVLREIKSRMKTLTEAQGSRLIEKEGGRLFLDLSDPS